MKSDLSVTDWNYKWKMMKKTTRKENSETHKKWDTDDWVIVKQET